MEAEADQCNPKKSHSRLLILYKGKVVSDGSPQNPSENTPPQARIPQTRRGSPADPQRIPRGSPADPPTFLADIMSPSPSSALFLRPHEGQTVGMQIPWGTPVDAHWCLSGVLATARPTSSPRAPSYSPFSTHPCGTRGAGSQCGSNFFDPGGLSFLAQWRPKAPQRIPS